jgi:hypothetical protein
MIPGNMMRASSASSKSVVTSDQVRTNTEPVHVCLPISQCTTNGAVYNTLVPGGSEGGLDRIDVSGSISGSRL